MKKSRLLTKLWVLGLILTLMALPFMTACAKPAPAPAPTPTPSPTPAPSPSPTPTPTPTPAAKPVTWIFATNMGASPAWWPFHPDPIFQSMLTKATGGRLVLDTKVNLVPTTEVVPATIDGRADLGLQLVPYISGTFPLWSYGSLPFFFEDLYQYESAVNDPRLSQILDANYRKVGLIRLMESSSALHNGVIFSNKPLATIEDFSGLKVRASGLLIADAFKAIGASPLTLPFAELADALKRGTVDAVAAGASFGIGQGMADVTSYLNIWGFEPIFPVVLVANVKSFEALPADLQQILRNLSREWQARMFTGGDSVSRLALSLGAAAGLKLVSPEKAQVDRAITLTAGVVDKWLGLTGADGKAAMSIISEYASGAKRAK